MKLSNVPLTPTVLFALISLNLLLVLMNLGNLLVHTGWSDHDYGGLQCTGYGEQIACTLLPVAAAELSADATPAQPLLTRAEQRYECIALAVFTEARGESVLGQAAVAQTVINREQRRGQDACEVVTDAAQYQGLEHLTADPWLLNQRAWDRAVQIATAVALHTYNTGACAAATDFHGPMAGGGAPKWAASKREVCRVGAHRFYREG